MAEKNNDDGGGKMMSKKHSCKNEKKILKILNLKNKTENLLWIIIYLYLLFILIIIKKIIC